MRRRVLCIAPGVEKLAFWWRLHDGIWRSSSLLWPISCWISFVYTLHDKVTDVFKNLLGGKTGLGQNSQFRLLSSSGLAARSSCTWRCPSISVRIALALAEHISASQKQQKMSSRVPLWRFVLIPFKLWINTFLVTLVRHFVIVRAVIKQNQHLVDQWFTLSTVTIWVIFQKVSLVLLKMWCDLYRCCIKLLRPVVWMMPFRSRLS